MKLFFKGLILSIASISMLLGLSACGTNQQKQTGAQRNALAHKKKQKYLEKHKKMVQDAHEKALDPQNNLHGTWKPRTKTQDKLVSVEQFPRMSAAVYQSYNLSKNVFTNEIQWDIWAGCLKSNSSTGVLLIFNMPKNFKEKIISVKNSGPIVITGYKGNHVIVKSKKGKGIYNLSSGKLTW